MGWITARIAGGRKRRGMKRSEVIGNRKSCESDVIVHRYPVNVTAYAHLRLPAAMGHMLWPYNCIGL